MKERHDPSTKPYHKCLSCQKFRSVCGGIPTRGMDLAEWCEYMRDVKELAHLTNGFISKEADVSLGTIERIMAINIDKVDDLTAVYHDNSVSSLQCRETVCDHKRGLARDKPVDGLLN